MLYQNRYLRILIIMILSIGLISEVIRYSVKIYKLHSEIAELQVQNNMINRDIKAHETLARGIKKKDTEAIIRVSRSMKYKMKGETAEYVW